MAEALPTAQPVMLHIGDGTGNGAVFVPKTGAALMLDGQPIDKIEIKGYNKNNILPGLEGARLAKTHTDDAGNITYPELSYNPGESVRQEDADGILLRQQDGTDKFFPLSEFTVESPESTPVTESAPEPQPATPLTNLEKRATEVAKPTSISLIGLDVDQSIQARAARDMEKIAAEGGNWFQRLTRGIWKGNIAHELLEQRAYQFRKKQVENAHMMLSDETFAVIESRAETAYTDVMNKKTAVGRAWTKFKDAIARNIGAETTKEKLAIAEAGKMFAAGELATIQQYEDNLAAVRTRYEKDFLDADGVIRKNLGESLTILSSDDPRHKEIVDGIKDLVHKYVQGDEGFASKRELEAAMADFAKTQGIGADSKTAKEAQLYASSLYTIADEAKARITSGESMSTIDAQLDAMEVRIGRAQMGESTQFQQSKTEKIVTWMASKNLIGTLFTNEASAGTAAAVALTLGYLPRYFASRAARLAGGAVGGGAVAGTIAGLKENARMKREYFQFMRQRETGAGDPMPGDTLRQWMKAREIPQVEVSSLISRYTATAYKDGTFNADISDEDLTKTLAYLADAKARRALSARGGANVSLIRWGQAVDVGRANLDLSIDTLEKDLVAKFGQTITERTKLLTDAQTRVLSVGRYAAALDDPLAVALDAVKGNDIGVQMFRRKLGIWGKAASKGEAQGLDAALKDIKTQIALEATRRGVNSAVIGSAIGTALSEGGFLLAHPDDVWGDIQHVLHLGPQVTTEIPVATHLTEVPNLVHITDGQGIDHAIQASIPNHTILVPDAATHTYTLMDADNHTLIHGIMIDDHGQITNSDVLNSSPDAIAHGLHFTNSSYEIPLAGTPQPPGIPETTPIPGTIDIRASEWGEGGYWEQVENKLSDESLEYHNAAVNAVKNALRSYEKNFVTDETGHVTNIELHPPEGFTQTIPYHDTPGTPMGGTEVYYNALPQSAVIHDLPASLFSDEGMAQLAHVTDEAAKMYNSGIPADQMDQLHQIALKAYFGMEQHVFTKDDLQYLMDHLDGTPAPTPIPVPAEPLFQQLYQGIIEQHVDEVSTVVPAAVPLVTDLPAVVPLPRVGMKPGEPTTLPWEKLAFTPKLPESRLRDLYTSGVSLPALQAWLKEHPNRLQTYKKISNADGTEQWVDKDGKPVTRDIAREWETISVYLEGIKKNDPTYYEYLVTLSKESTMPPMKDECRVSVNIPAWMEGKIIHNTLTEYTRQTDQSGNPLNPDVYEINIIVNRKTGAPPDTTVGEIQRFIEGNKAQGKDFKINYVDVEFDPPNNNVGNARKVITDLTLLRSNQRAGATGQLYIESEDADLLHVDPHTVTNLVTKLDGNPHLDAVSGIQDRDPEILMKNDYLFLDRRMWDFIGTMLQRREKYRPENNPNWHNWWNRTITGGWNTGYTAESYALIGGHDSGLVMGEDTIIGEKISMIRGDGQNPNLDVVGTVPSRSDSSPRRFINEVITGKGAYSDTFGDEELNIRLKTATIDELLTMISPVARITPDNEGTFKNMIAWRLDQLKDLSVNEVEAVKDFKLAMTFLGFKQGDYEITPDGHVNITSLEHIKQALEDYRQRHQVPRKPGERTNYGTEPTPAVEQTPEELAATTPITEPVVTPEPAPQPETEKPTSLFELLDTNGGSVTIKPDDVPTYLPKLVTQLAPVLRVPAEDITITPTHTGDTWHIEAKTKDVNQVITVDIAPDDHKGFAVKLHVKGFGITSALTGLVTPERILSGINGKLMVSEITKLTLRPDGTIEFTGKKK